MIVVMGTSKAWYSTLVIRKYGRLCTPIPKPGRAGLGDGCVLHIVQYTMSAWQVPLLACHPHHAQMLA